VVVERRKKLRPLEKNSLKVGRNLVKPSENFRPTMNPTSQGPAKNRRTHATRNSSVHQVSFSHTLNYPKTPRKEAEVTGSKISAPPLTSQKAQDIGDEDWHLRDFEVYERRGQLNS
jgi:hypothetical protein